MMRTILLLGCVATLVLAGCIAPDATPQPPSSGSPPAPGERVDGMSATATKSDKEVPCSSSNQTVSLPQFCAERNLTVVGAVGVSSLPVDLVATNGGITIREGEGNAWSFHAIVRVEAPTQSMADAGLDTAWTWSHESGGKHALRAGPAQATNATPVPVGLPAGAAQVVSARYEVTLPAWLVVDALHLETDNGQLAFSGSATDATLATTNGQVVLDLTPAATGKVTVSTSNGMVEATIHRASGHGLDADGKTTNGLVSFAFSGGELTSSQRNHEHFVSDGFDAASVQTTLAITTDNGMISARDG